MPNLAVLICKSLPWTILKRMLRLFTVQNRGLLPNAQNWVTFMQWGTTAVMYIQIHFKV